MRLRLSFELKKFPSEIDAMPDDDKKDLYALLSLEPSPQDKIDLGLANLAYIVNANIGGKATFDEMKPFWLKLGQPPTMKDKIYEQLDSGKTMEEISKSEELIEYNRSKFKLMGKSLEAMTKNGRNRK